MAVPALSVVLATVGLDQIGRVLGDVRDQTVSKVKEITRDTYDQVRETAKLADEGVKADIGQPVSDS